MQESATKSVTTQTSPKLATHLSDDYDEQINKKFTQILINIDRLELGDKIRVGSISEIYEGKLLTTDTKIDVICKAIQKSTICKYNLFTYILREVLIGMCVNTEYAVKHYGLVYNKQKKYICIIIEKFGSINLLEYITLNKLCTTKRIDLAISILKIIEHLHSNNIIHRDIKLANFLIRDGVIKICDFGTAVINKQQMFSYCGTLTHMAPEILSRDNYDFKIDYWSYAILLIELFATQNGIDLIMINNILIKNYANVSIILPQYITDLNIIKIIDYIITNYKQKKDIDVKFIYESFQTIIVTLINSASPIDAQEPSNPITPGTECENDIKFSIFLEKIDSFDFNAAEKNIHDRSSNTERPIMSGL